MVPCFAVEIRGQHLQLATLHAITSYISWHVLQHMYHVACYDEDHDTANISLAVDYSFVLLFKGSQAQGSLSMAEQHQEPVGNDVDVYRLLHELWKWQLCVSIMQLHPSPSQHTACVCFRGKLPSHLLLPLQESSSAATLDVATGKPSLDSRKRGLVICTHRGSELLECSLTLHGYHFNRVLILLCPLTCLLFLLNYQYNLALVLLRLHILMRLLCF